MKKKKKTHHAAARCKHAQDSWWIRCKKNNVNTVQFLAQTDCFVSLDLNQNQNELYCQVCLHTRGICFHDKSYRSATEWQWQNKNTEKKEPII